MISYLLGVYTIGITIPYVLFGDEAGFHLSGYVKHKLMCTNAMLMESVLLHEVWDHVCYAMRATKLNGPILFSETINSH